MRPRLSTAGTVLALIVLPVSNLAGGPAEAGVAGSCGGAFVVSETCQFWFAGPDLTVFGSSSTGATISVAIRDPAGTLLVCVGSGGCGASSSHTPHVSPTVEPPAGVPLTCVVQGGGSGTYSCLSRTL